MKIIPLGDRIEAAKAHARACFSNGDKRLIVRHLRSSALSPCQQQWMYVADAILAEGQWVRPYLASPYWNRVEGAPQIASRGKAENTFECHINGTYVRIAATGPFTVTIGR